jgi:hypothetical protein
MSIFTQQYQKFLKPEKRIARSLIRPRNIYRIITYKGGNPITKTGQESRYVFVIGVVNEKIHCIKLNPVRPLFFIELIKKLRDKRVTPNSQLRLEYMLKKFARDGSALFDGYIKTNKKLYNTDLKNYRTYILDKIVNVYEIRFEQDILDNLFGTINTQSEVREILRDENTEIDDINNQSLNTEQ